MFICYKIGLVKSVACKVAKVARDLESSASGYSSKPDAPAIPVRRKRGHHDVQAAVALAPPAAVDLPLSMV